MTNAPVELAALKFDMADRLRKSLRVADMGVQEIARDLDVSRNTVSRWLSGAAEPRRAYVRAWAMATGVPYVWLETGTAPSPGGDGAVDGVPPKGFEPSTFRSNVRRFTAVHTVAA